MDIGKTLTDLRKSKNISRQIIADELGMSIHTYIKYENGTTKPTYETLSKLADFYGVTTDYLLGRDAAETDPLELLHISAADKAMIQAYLSLESNERRILSDLIQKIAKSASETE